MATTTMHATTTVKRRTAAWIGAGPPLAVAASPLAQPIRHRTESAPPWSTGPGCSAPATGPTPAADPDQPPATPSLPG
jgi:hypothetical protein